ncbi:MAG: hypothetical protein CV087_10550 [Candidatus Brocadia sp. WS118]|nr:MAG: hypothetical protein CV087_10550 [Candidatus Brocadia sp. WS118]
MAGRVPGLAGKAPRLGGKVIRLAQEFLFQSWFCRKNLANDPANLVFSIHAPARGAARHIE